ncbi:MAG: DotU family type IV/VI secretion system protein [Acidobacteriia bacterium]|nr:DotU family type IV/VI secretion system protein [Terriglobia bacterium]
MSSGKGEEQLDQVLRELGAAMRQQQAPGRVEAALLEAYRNRHQRSRHQWRNMWPVWAIASAAAVVVVAVVLKAPEPAVNQPAAQVVKTATPTPVAPALGIVVAEPEPKKVAAGAPRNSRSEIVTDFFPLRNGPVFEDDVSQLVRVRLPRTTLTRYGLPGGQDGPESTVRADVLLGRDGMARAIRFVR